MTYRPKPETEHWQAPPGLAPWRELSDEEYAALEAEHGELSRWYERASEIDETATTRKRRPTAGGDS